jgi:hypothetical protein
VQQLRELGVEVTLTAEVGSSPPLPDTALAAAP